MKFNKKVWISLSIMLPIIALTIWLNPLDVHAAWWWEDDTEEAVNFLKNHSDWLQLGSFLSVIGHTVAWWIVKLLYLITSMLEGLIPESLNLLDFLDDSGLQGITRAIINDLVVVLMTLTIAYLGIKTIISKEPPNFKSVGVNIFISALLIVGLPSLMDTMEDVAVDFFDSTQTGSNNDGNSSLAWNLIQENTADLVYVADTGFDLIENGADDTRKNNLTPEIFKAINLAEIITPDAIEELDTDNEQLKYLTYTLSTDGQGNYTATEIKNGFLAAFSDSFESGYFRYPVKYMPIILGLIALAIAYAFTIFVFVTTIIEIAFKKVVGIFVFATDLESGQKTKMVMNDIFSAFLLIAFTGLSFKMYTIFLTYLSAAKVNFIIYIVAIVCATFVLIKGSNTIMRYFGVDVGLKDGFAQMAGALAAGKMLTNMASSPFKKGNKDTNSKDDIDKTETENENEGKSVNDSKEESSLGKLKNSINQAGKSFGYMKERGLSGMAEDSLMGATEKAMATTGKVGESIGQVGKSIKDGTNGLKDSWNTGVESGVDTAKTNSEKWDSRKSAKQDSSLNENNEGLGASNMIANPNVPNDNSGAKSGENGALNNTLNNSPLNSSTSGKSNEEILAEMKLKDTMNPLRQDIEQGELKGNGSVGNATALRQDIEQGELKGNGSVGNATALRQDIEQGELKGNGSVGNATALRQDIEQGEIKGSGAAGNMAAIRQDIEQGEIKGSGAAGNMAAIRQDIEQGELKGNGSVGNATALRQDIEQGEIKGSGATGNVAIQKVVQEIQGNSTKSPDELKARVSQILDNSSLVNNETVRQKVVQEVDKAFVPAPEQLQQNIQQVLTKSSMPSAVSEAIQRVVQESNGSNQTEVLKAKVVQEVEKASFGNETTRQTVMQDIQNAFTSTPEQLQQNIKQVFETTTNEISKGQTEVAAATVESPKSYGNSPISHILGVQSVEEFEKNRKQKRNSRFAFMKK